jgi:hypothetical protein
MKLYFLPLVLVLSAASLFSQTSSPNYKKITDLQAQKGWSGYALLSPSWAICSSCSSNGSNVNWSRVAGVGSPSLTGKATKHSIGGTRPFSDILWNNHLIGAFSSQGIPDTNHTLIPKLHNFVYDVYFYANNISASQALEFDINQFMGSSGRKGFIWGHECRIAGGHQWDIYDNVHKKWIATGVPCNPKNNAWNHLILTVQRTASNQLLFKSITLNGHTATLNHIENPGYTTWNGVTINYQQDGNRAQTRYPIWLDKLNFIYW